ncbi:hypothetical protein BJ742DRAFT_426489 [Cladochytrium replicatum]|nr:hypothetical protein BJ742DRAFT_426489 [Cladochytrium replicatum]
MDSHMNRSYELSPHELNITYAPTLAFLNPTIVTPGNPLGNVSTPNANQPTSAPSSAHISASSSLAPPTAAHERRPSAVPSSKTSTKHRTASKQSQNLQSIVRFVSTIVHLMVNKYPYDEQCEHDASCPSKRKADANEWISLASDTGAKPSAALYAFTHRILSIAKLPLPAILTSLKYLDLHQRYCARRKALMARRMGGGQSDFDDDLVANRMRNTNVPTLERPREMMGRSSNPTGPFAEYALLVSSLICANKFLEDNRFSNRWWSKVSELPVEEINSAELKFLCGVGFDLYLENDEYSEWVEAMDRFRRWQSASEERSSPGPGYPSPPHVAQQSKAVSPPTSPGQHLHSPLSLASRLSASPTSIPTHLAPFKDSIPPPLPHFAPSGDALYSQLAFTGAPPQTTLDALIDKTTQLFNAMETDQPFTSEGRLDAPQSLPRWFKEGAMDSSDTPPLADQQKEISLPRWWKEGIGSTYYDPSLPPPPTAFEMALDPQTAALMRLRTEAGKVNEGQHLDYSRSMDLG